MILADKISVQRKKNGWSQEELAEKLGVSRQSVSKWEGAQSIPDLEKVLRLAQLFGVTTDYLLKDEVENEEYAEELEEGSIRKVSLHEANEFLAVKAYTAGRIAFATILCILSPITLLLLAAASEIPGSGISENLAGGVGIMVMLLFVIPAVAIFIYCGSKTAAYEYLEKEIFEAEYGVLGMVKERQKQYQDTYTKSNILGTCFCIAAVIPLLMTAFFSDDNDMIICVGLCLLIAIVAVGVRFFIVAGINWTSMQKLLQEGEYSKIEKMNTPILGALSTVYWLLIVAGYLGYSFATNDWKSSWILWPVAGVVYAALAVLVSTFVKRDK